MTNEEKRLLFRDLCVRLPYGVRVKLNGRREKSNKLTIDWLYTYSRHIEDIKPYLRPMSSMKATENIEYQKRVKVIQDVERTLHWCDTPESIDWLDEHHFDYRGLIGKGLALKAPNGMYNNQ